MLKQSRLTADAVQQVRLIPVKLSKFTPQIKDRYTSLGRYSEEQRVEQRRTMVHSSFSTRPIFTPEAFHYRVTLTSQTSRLSHYVQSQVSKLHEDSGEVEKFSPTIREKIKELKSLINQKAAILRNPKTKLPTKCYFSEYKMACKEGHQPHTFTLHSRKKMDSPYMRALKTKKAYISKDEESEDDQNAPKNKKMVLIGGGIPSRQSQSDENSVLKPSTKLSERLGSKSIHRYYLRSGRGPSKSSIAESIPENDCKPWEIHKWEHLQQYGHLNYL